MRLALTSSRVDPWDKDPESGSHRGGTGTVEAQVFQKTVDFPNEYAHGFHINLDDRTWVTVRRDQVEIPSSKTFTGGGKHCSQS